MTEPRVTIWGAGATDPLLELVDNASSTLLTVTSTGELGIKTLPSVGVDLNVAGAVRTTTFRINTGGSIVNNSSVNNGRILSATTGWTFDRNVADANPLVIFQQLHAGSTGDIVQFKNNAATLGVFTQAGNLGIATTSPFLSLSVGGDGWFDGDLRVVGTLDSSDIAFNNLQGQRIWTITEGDRVGERADDLVFVNADGKNVLVLHQDGTFTGMQSKARHGVPWWYFVIGIGAVIVYVEVRRKR